MEFEIERTSDYLKENKPCDKAYLADESECGRNIYKIKIDTLEDLISLMNEVGRIIIKQDLSIEIYDDWRE